MNQEMRDPKGLTLHPVLEQIPAMGPDEFGALVASVREGGVKVPIDVTEDGRVVDGRNRLAVAKQLNLPGIPVRIVPADVDALAHALESALNRRQLTTSGKVLLLFLAHPDLAEDRAPGRPRKGNVDSINNYRKLSERYGVPNEYFTFLAQIRDACSEHEWAMVKDGIFNHGTAITALRAGMASKAVVKGKKRSDPKYHLLIPKVATTLTNAFKGWGHISFGDGQRETMLSRFGEAFSVMPAELRAVNIQAITHWPQHDQDALFKALKSRR